jgi:uncharacterized protein
MLRTALDRRDGGLCHVTGARGVGKSALVRAASEGLSCLIHRVPPLSEPQQRAAFAAQVGGAFPAEDVAAGDAAAPPAGWADTWDRLAESAPEGRPLVIALDDAHRLVESRARVGPHVLRALRRARARGASLHVVLVGAPGLDLAAPAAPGARRDPGVSLEDEPVEVRLGPLSLRPAMERLPGSTPLDRIRAYAIFGGTPAHLRTADPGATLWTNVRRAFLDPGAPLGDRGLDLLERDVQTPARYAAILAALAPGEADWATVHRGVPDLTTSGQLAPYLRRLEELGLVETRASLDARPHSRNRRYRIVDPLVAFWFAIVLPYRYAASTPDPARWLSDVVRPSLDAHVASVFPEICRQHMALDAMEWAGSNAREHGSLWGPGYDIDSAGLLTSGAAFYGRAIWGDQPVGPEALATLDAMVGETRYGFGRERRTRVVFSSGGFAPSVLRQAARRHDVTLVDARALVGE